MHSIMWPIKEKENRQINARAKFYPLNQAVGRRRYGSLFNINTSGSIVLQFTSLREK